MLFIVRALSKTWHCCWLSGGQSGEVGAHQCRAQGEGCTPSPVRSETQGTAGKAKTLGSNMWSSRGVDKSVKHPPTGFVLAQVKSTSLCYIICQKSMLFSCVSDHLMNQIVLLCLSHFGADDFSFGSG